jgi:hypothetical protein
MTHWRLGELPFFDIEDEHLVKCDLWVGRLNWPTGSMSVQAGFGLPLFCQIGAAMRRLIP